MATNGFSVLKILQALYYIQAKAPSGNQDRFNIVYLLKMIFFSDRYHLRHFGITATLDNYYAMKLGPVASSTYDILKGDLLNLDCSDVKYLSSIKEIDRNNVEIKQQEEDELSASFKESIDFALKEFGHCSWGTLSELSHLYPEWKKHESELSGFVKSAQMSEPDFFDDPDDSVRFADFGKESDPFKDDKEYLALRKEHYDEYHISR
jgi:uncharacterized phage-associated protein